MEGSSIPGQESGLLRLALLQVALRGLAFSNSTGPFFPNPITRSGFGSRAQQQPQGRQPFWDNTAGHSDATSDIRPQPPVGCCLSLFADYWEEIKTDAWVRTLPGIPLLSPKVFILLLHFQRPCKRELMELAIQHLLDIWAFQPVLPDQWGQGFYLILFVIPKASGVRGVENYSEP